MLGLHLTHFENEEWVGPGSFQVGGMILSIKSAPYASTQTKVGWNPSCFLECYIRAFQS